MNPLISIAMTTYNGEKYLVEQLDSILSQTYPDIELIICDDCSKDSTVEIIQEYCKKDNRIKLFINRENLGFKKNFEKAISLCSGDYIALSDQDDIWTPDHLEKLFILIQGHKLACGNAELIDEQGKKLRIKLNEVDELYCFNDSDNLLYKILCSRNAFQGASMLMHKTFLAKTIPIPEIIPFHDTWFALCSCFEDRIRYTFDIITFYRQHLKQTTTHIKRNTFQRILNSIIKIFRGKKYSPEKFKYINEIKKRYNISKGQEEIIKNSTLFLNMKSGKLGLKDRIKAIKFYWNKYDYIHTFPNHKYRIVRIIKNAILGLTNE